MDVVTGTCTSKRALFQKQDLRFKSAHRVKAGLAKSVAWAGPLDSLFLRICAKGMISGASVGREGVFGDQESLNSCQQLTFVYQVCDARHHTPCSVANIFIIPSSPQTLNLSQNEMGLC